MKHIRLLLIHLVGGDVSALHGSPLPAFCLVSNILTRNNYRQSLVFIPINLHHHQHHHHGSVTSSSVMGRKLKRPDSEMSLLSVSLFMIITLPRSQSSSYNAMHGARWAVSYGKGNEVSLSRLLPTHLTLRTFPPRPVPRAVWSGIMTTVDVSGHHRLSLSTI